MIDLSGLYHQEITNCFSELQIGKSVTEFYLHNHAFCIEACRNMVPFLRASTNLTHIDIESGKGFDTDCFEVVMRALSGGPIISITLQSQFSEGGCIESIAVLEDCELSHLNHLDLSNNKICHVAGLEKCTSLETLQLEQNPIGAAGCMGLSKLFKTSTSLIEVTLCETNIDDEGAEILADSLKHNDTLYLLEMTNTKMTEKGPIAFLKLVCDISSIARTYDSNHSLTDLYNAGLSNNACQYVRSLHENNNGRSKVIKFQLNSENRKAMHRFQGIEYEYSSIFSEIDPLVLPDVLALVGREHGQTELYRMLVASVSDLESTMNRKAIIKQKIEEKTAQIAALAAEIRDLNRTLEHIEMGEKERRDHK